MRVLSLDACLSSGCA